MSRARADVTSALAEAARSNKRVLVDFGGNWCGDCKVLDINLRKPENIALLESDGRVVYSQKNGEFESMRKIDPKSVQDFLERWKAPRP